MILLYSVNIGISPTKSIICPAAAGAMDFQEVQAMETYGIEKYGITGTTEEVYGYDIPVEALDTPLMSSSSPKRPSRVWRAMRLVRSVSWAPSTS